MTLWRYQAVVAESGGAVRRSGELAGETAADVRASLRRIGLQVTDLRPARSWRIDARKWLFLNSLIEISQRHFRGRRSSQRAELYDSLHTMLQAGLPLLDAVEAIVSSAGRGSYRSMLIDVRERLRGGEALAEAMNESPAWFDQVEVAMIKAAQHGGTLPQALGYLAERRRRAGELSGKLMGALAYPTIVTVVGLAVTVFLSVKTLPDLTSILTGAGIEVPTLTAAVMAVGGFLSRHWLVIAVGAIALTVLTTIVLQSMLRARGISWPPRLRRMYPRLLRRLAIAQFAEQLAGLLRAGIPMVEALRVLAPSDSTRVAVTRGLALVLSNVADRVERGEDLAHAFDDDMWFDAEFRRLLEIGQTCGELDDLLMRIADRYSRQARRLIDRLASLLEPMVILALAALVGVVVMAAVLPLLRMREML